MSSNQPNIDCNKTPSIPQGWAIHSHVKNGIWQWNPGIELFLSEIQAAGKTSVEGNELQLELAEVEVLNANVLDYLLEHQGIIPTEWQGKFIFFWGTIYQVNGEKCVRCLQYIGKVWNDYYYYVKNNFGQNCPAALAI